MLELFLSAVLSLGSQAIAADSSSLRAESSVLTAEPAVHSEDKRARVQTLVLVGDSITEGYGVAKEKSYPTLLEQRLQDSKKNWKVINSSIGGSTSASALSRANWVLKSQPQIVVLFLGGNDALRGLAPSEMKKNIELAIQALKRKGVRVFLVEMLAPPNYGAKYTTDFQKVFKDLQKEQKVELIPFPLKDTAGKKNFNQADGIHPNEKGHAQIADFIFNFLIKYL